MGENVLRVLIEFMQVDMVIIILNYCCVQSLKPHGEGILKIRGSTKVIVWELVGFTHHHKT